jgi:hypothetical protein
MEVFIKPGYEMLKISILCTKVRGNYSSCTCRSSENICSSSGSAQEKKERRGQNRIETQFGTKSGAFLSLTPFNANVLLWRFFLKISPGFGPNFCMSLSNFGCKKICPSTWKCKTNPLYISNVLLYS